jgi:hypothetical protein
MLPDASALSTLGCGLPEMPSAKQQSARPAHGGKPSLVHKASMERMRQREFITLAERCGAGRSAFTANNRPSKASSPEPKGRSGD